MVINTEPRNILLKIWSAVATYWAPALCCLIGIIFYAASKAEEGDVILQFVPELFRNEFSATSTLSFGFSILAAKIFADLSESKILSRIEATVEDGKRELIADTTKAILGSSLPRPYFDEVVSTCFAPGFVRENFRATYTLSPVEGNTETLCLTVEMYSHLRNFGETTRKYSFKSSWPNAFRHLGLYTTISEISLRGSKLDRANIENQVAGQKHLAEIEIRAPEIDIQPGQSIPVVTRIRMFKNRSDNEAFRSLYPCEHMTVVLSGFKQCGLDVGISSIHRIPFTVVPHNDASDVREWKLSEFTLPQNGWVIYWNPIRAAHQP